MKADESYCDGRLTVSLTGELDHHSAKETLDAISGSIERYMPRDLTLDLRNLSFMDSSGIAVMVRSYNKMRLTGGRMSIVDPQPQPLKVIDASGIDRLLPVAAKREVTT